jgi:hypothetical protein
MGYNQFGIIPRTVRWRRFHFSTKSGPNGHALNTCFEDLFILPKTLIDSIKVLGGERLVPILDGMLANRTLLAGFFSVVASKGIFRKITYFADKEGKTRVIAIGDYFSQTVLKGLHLFLFKVLKRIPQDCTFDQGSFKDKIKGWEVFYSIDLTAATDRFPISLISCVLGGYLPERYVKAWEDVMVGYPFKAYLPRGNRDVSYSVGNPMGFYSSWSSFALTHHYLFFYLCHNLNIP